MTTFIRTLIALSLFSISSFSIAQDTNFQPWSENFFIHLEKKYGKPGADRVRKLHALAIKNLNEPVEVKLKVTNDALNQLPWIADQEKYDKNDYWATPMETIATFGGDCEDMAIAKFMMLRVLGVPKENMRLSYVKIKKTGEAHMVLVYLSDPDNLATKSSIYVLDSYEKEMKLAKDRKDLYAVYLIDVNKNLTLIGDDGSKRTVKNEIDTAKFAKLDKIKQKIKENKENAKQYNDGRPLF